jgi:hypothetical protein
MKRKPSAVTTALITAAIPVIAAAPVRVTAATPASSPTHVTAAAPAGAPMPSITATPASAFANATPDAKTSPPNAAVPNPLAGLPAVGAKNLRGCLASGDGYLRARIRGAIVLDVSLRNSELECDGGPRPDGSGIRVSFAGPARSDGRRLRMVFGVAKATEGAPGRELPTNLTVIFEGEQRMFATRGDDKCTVDEFKQERLGALGGPTRNYRVIARGFCIAPVKALSSEQRILVNSFDFAGNILFEDAPAADTTSATQRH